MKLPFAVLILFPLFTLPLPAVAAGNTFARDAGAESREPSEAGVPAVEKATAEALGDLTGSVVVVKADTGQLLALVNERLALSAGFQPCSTIKLAVALGALEEGLLGADTLLRVSPRQSINLTEALAYSNNRFFELLGGRMGFAKVSEYARLLGFGERAGLGLAGESAGKFPGRPPRRGGVERFASFGEEIKATPLQLAALMAAFANGGRLNYLQTPRTDFAPRVKRHLPIQRWLPALRAGMEAAVFYGTARASAEAAERILGKTGTCVENRARLGWFASYGEVSTGERFAVVVLLRGGRWLSGKVAAEVAGQVYRRLEEIYSRGRSPEWELVSAGNE